MDQSAGRFVEERHVAHGKLELIVAVLLHFAPQSRSARQFDRHLDLVLVSLDGQLHSSTNLVLANERGQFFVILQATRSEFFIIDGEDHVFDFESGFFGAALRINLRHVEPFQVRLPELPGNISTDDLRLDWQPGLRDFESGIFGFFDADLHDGKILRHLALECRENRSAFRRAMRELSSEVI